MSKEEIIDRLFKYKNEDEEMKYQPEDILTIEDVWLLLDYITNLQQENKQLKKRNKELEDGFKSATDELCEYATKIDKAIDFIKHNAIYSEFPMLPSDTLELLEILGDKENE